MKRKYLVRFVLLFTFGVLLGVTLIVAVYQVKKREDRFHVEAFEVRQVSLQKLRIENQINAMFSDISIIINMHELVSYADIARKETLTTFATDLMVIATNKPVYNKIAFLDKSGQELVKVDRTHGRPRKILEKDLHNLYESVHFQRGSTLSIGDILISHVFPNTILNQVEIPVRPLIRFVAPVFDKQGNSVGLLDIEYDVTDLIREFKANAKSGTGELWLINQDGYWLVGPDQESEWGFSFSDKREQNIKIPQPEIWNIIQKRKRGQFILNGSLVTTEFVEPDGYGLFLVSTEIPVTQGAYFSIVSFVPQEILNTNLRNQNRDLLITLYIVFAILVFFMAGVSYFLIKTQSRRQRAEDALRDANRKLEETVVARTADLRKLTAAVEQSGSTVVITNADGKIEYVNPAFISVTGYSLDEVLGKSPNILKSGRHDAAFYQNLWSTILKGETWRGEMINRKKNGEFYWEIATISPIKDQVGNTTHYVAIKEDISEKKNVEDTLRQSEEKFRLLFETMAHGVIVQDKGGAIVDANSAAEEILGETADQLQRHPLDSHWWETVLENGTALALEDHPVSMAFESGNSVNDMMIGVQNHTLSERRWILVNVTPQWAGDNAEVDRVYVTFSDMTERNQIAAELLESRNRYQELIEGTTDLVTQVDSDGKFLFINHMSNEIFGLAPEECVGKRAFDFVHPDDQIRTYEWFARKIQNRQSWGTIENRQLHKSGYTRYLLWTVNFYYKNGQLVSANSIARDISERKFMEDSLKSAKNRADEANQAKSAFLANMSHELRTPLNSIIGFTQILGKQLTFQITAKQRRFFENIRSSGFHLLDMVNDILDLSKIEAGKIELQRELFDFGEMLVRSPSIIKASAVDKEIIVRVNVDPNLGWLEGDETKLKQVCFNLLSNAVKFTDSHKQIGFEATVVGDMFQITVWDEGIGIPLENQDLIFDPFERLPRKGMQQIEGTGLGLAISKRLVELHDGTITVESEVGKGSRFVIRIPGRIVVGEMAKRGAAAKKSMNVEGRVDQLKILITEDNKVNRELLEFALDQYTLDYAISGEEALEKVKKERFDLILMDIRLPGIDGVECMKLIRKYMEEAPVIIALTAFAMKGDEEKYLREGFDAYLSKPIVLDDLYALIDRVAIHA